MNRLENFVRNPVETLRNGAQKAVEMASGLFALAFVVESINYTVNRSSYAQDVQNAMAGTETIETTQRLIQDNLVRSVTILTMYKTGVGNVVYNVGGKLIPGMVKLAAEGVVGSTQSAIGDARNAINNKIEEDRIPNAQPVSANRRVTFE